MLPGEIVPGGWLTGWHLCGIPGFGGVVIQAELCLSGPFLEHEKPTRFLTGGASVARRYPVTISFLGCEVKAEKRNIRFELRFEKRKLGGILGHRIEQLSGF